MITEPKLMIQHLVRLHYLIHKKNYIIFIIFLILFYIIFNIILLFYIILIYIKMIKVFLFIIILLLILFNIQEEKAMNYTPLDRSYQN